MSVNIRTNCDYYSKVIVFKARYKERIKADIAIAAYDVNVDDNRPKWWISTGFEIVFENSYYVDVCIIPKYLHVRGKIFFVYTN